VQVPALAYNVAYAVDPSYVETAPGYIILSHMRNLLVNVNSAVNFILYCAVGQKFRRVFLQTFGLSCCRDVDRPPTVVLTHVDGSWQTMSRSQLGRFGSARPQAMDCTVRQGRQTYRMSSL